MTIITTFYAMDNKEGVDLNFIQTSVTLTNLDAQFPRAKIGDRVQGNGGSEWYFTQASATVTSYNVISIGANGKCENTTSVHMTSNAYVYGVAEFAPNQLGTTVSIGNANGGVANPGDYFWAALKIATGGQVNAAITAALGAKLFITSSLAGGQLTSSAQVIQMTGIALVGTILATISVPQTMEYVQYGYLVPYASV